MLNLLEVANCRQYGKNVFNDHALIVGEKIVHYQISRITFFGMKNMIGENDCLFFKLVNQRMKVGIMHDGRGTFPDNHLAEMVEHQA
jgi:hypothetical protein